MAPLQKSNMAGGPFCVKFVGAAEGRGRWGLEYIPGTDQAFHDAPNVELEAGRLLD